jgi:hypothetical protein
MTLSATKPAAPSSLRRLCQVATVLAGLFAMVLPSLVALPASAAAAPVLTCSSSITGCTTGLAAFGQGYSGEVYVVGANLYGSGPVFLTSSAPGVVFSQATELSPTEASATVTIPSTTPAGFYTLSLTDPSGTATLTTGLGVNPGPQIVSAYGTSPMVAAADSTVVVDGTDLSGASVTITGSGAPTIATPPTFNQTGTTLTFTLDNQYAVVGTYTYTITSAALPGSTPGVTTGTITETNNPSTPPVVTGSPVVVTPSLAVVGAGATSVIESFTTPPITDQAPSNWLVSSSVSGITFGPVTAASSTTLVTTITVDPTTTPTASVPVVITDNITTFDAIISTVAAPTVSGVLASPTITAGQSATLSITGTNFNPSWSNNTCALLNGGVVDAAVVCTITNTTSSDSTTSLTATVTAQAAALNGSDTLVVTDSTNGGTGTLASAVTVAGQPVITSLSPLSVPAQESSTLTIAGTNLNFTGCMITDTAFGGGVRTGSPTTCEVTQSSSLEATIRIVTALYAGDSLALTLSNSTSSVRVPVVIVSQPLYGLSMSPSTIIPGSNTMPFTIQGAGFLPAAVVSIPTLDGTVVTSTVEPSLITGTITVAPGLTSLTIPVTVTNTNNSSSTFSLNLGDAPTITGSYAAREGSKTTLVISGTGFVSGAVVTSSSQVTFGAAVTSNCTNSFCTTITTSATFLPSSSKVVEKGNLTVTNPSGYGSATAPGALSVVPGPAVTGVYYARPATMATLTVVGSGFEAGITATSSNPAFAVAVGSLSPSSLTLRVSTTSQAVQGTSSRVTLTNPDGSAVVFTVNGGVAPRPAIGRVVRSTLRPGHSAVVTVLGVGLSGVNATTNSPHVTVKVRSTTGQKAVLLLTASRSARVGQYRLVLKVGEYAASERFSVSK